MLTWFFQGLTGHLAERGFRTLAVSSPDERLEKFREHTGAAIAGVPMKREISPLSDLPAILRLWRLIRRCRPDIVHAHTPKAGLLAMIAARLAGVRIRIYTLHGLRLMTVQGWRFHLLRLAERAACALATDAYCVSRSVREVAVQLGICPDAKLRILGHGSCAGVSLERFDPARFDAAARRSIRASLGVTPAAPLVGFIGRLVRDKGIADLAAAWQVLRTEFPDAHLLLCGDFEPQDPVPDAVRRQLRADPRVHLTETFIDDMPPIYAALDVCVLPTYREGLPTVALEAGAMRVPIVATRVPGCLDAVADEATGLLVEPHAPTQLARAVTRLLRDPALRNRLGTAAREFVAARFAETQAFELLEREYRRLLAERKPGEGRLLDLAGAAAGLMLFAPLLAAVAVAVRLSMGTPVLFRQQRAGLGGRPFVLYKFRTMRERRGQPDDDRLTTLGRFLRYTSLDELPQLWNVCKGDMNLVGPRPLISQELPDEERFARRHDVRPGITGWAQVNGRNGLTRNEKFALDAWYVDHRSRALDLKILAATVWKVLRREGVEATRQGAESEFNPNKSPAAERA